MTGYNTSTGALTLNNVTVGTGANRLMLVGVVYESSSAGGGMGTVAWSYAGNALSILISSVLTNKYVIELGRLTNPPSGTNTLAISGQPLASIQRIGVVVLVLNGVDQTTPIANTNSGGDSSSSGATFPGTPPTISGGTFGMMFGAINYGVFGGPPDTPTPFSTIQQNSGAMGDSSGAAVPADCLFAFTGAYGGGSSSCSANANGSGAYSDIAGIVAVNAAPDPQRVPLTLQSLPIEDNLRLIESCLYN